MSSYVPILRQDPISYQRLQWIDAQMSAPPIGERAVSQFIAAPNSTTNGVDVSFAITDVTGMASLSLLRAAVMDIAQATVLQTWTASTSAFTWSDTDAVLQATGQAYYWLKLEPTTVNGSEVVVGPQFILLNPSLLPPNAATTVSASHAAAVNGTVLVTCNVGGVSQASGNSIKIYVTGYQGGISPVAVAQRTKAPIQFTLLATGETITIKAIVVSPGGAEAASGPTCTLVLNSTATVPAQVQNVTVAQTSSGNQITWPSSLEAGVTGYQIYRGQRGDGFLSATILATVAASSVGTMLYLDTGGLAGDYQYFLIAQAAAGNSLHSDAAFPPVLYSSAIIPSNVPVNTTNTATVDSVDAGASALIRCYGVGGVGTGYARVTGFGSLNRPYGSIAGLAYHTSYAVIFDTATQTYLASTTYAATLPDSYELIGVITTTAATGTSGSGAAATAVIDGAGHVIQINPNGGGLGSGYVSATVNISGGGGSGAAAVANVDPSGTIPSYTVTNGGSAYATAPTVTVVPGAAGGTTSGGGTDGSSDGSRVGIGYLGL